MPHTTIEIYIRRLPANSLVADARLTSVISALPAQLVTHAPIPLNHETLLAATNDAAIYGRLLSAQLFADRALRDAWLKVRTHTDASLQLSLRLDARAEDLHTIRWETLRDPQTGQPIALHERLRLVRAVDSADLLPVVIPPRPNLSALVVVASPSNLGTFRLAEVDVDGEVARARTALGDIPTTILGDHTDAQGRATMAQLVAHLRDEPAYVILVAHGTLRDGQTVLWLEQEDGRADQVAGTELVAAIERLTTRPLLMVLVSCQRAVRGYSDTLSTLGPGLSRVGVSAVLGFHGDVAMSTARAFLPMLISEVGRDGQIDRALAATRTALARQRRPWWQPVLWLRTDGRLWQESMSSQAVLPAAIAPAVGDLASRQGNVWRWDRFGQEVPAWLARQLDQHSELQDINLKPLKEASRRRWAQIDWLRAAHAYRDDLLGRYGLILLLGTRHPVHMADVLTDIYLIDRPGPWQRPTLEDLRRRPLAAADLPDTDVRREGLALVMRQRRLFIFGQPGVGKTTFLRRLALQAAHGQIDAVPIMVEIGIWLESNLDLMSYLTRQFAACGFPHAQPFLKTLLEQGQAMLLFDGLDAVGVHDARHQRMLQEIREFIQEYGQNRMLITCRTAASEYAFDQFKYCELDDFNQVQIEAFVDYWFQHDQQKSEALLRVLSAPEQRHSRDLARRPLLLVMLCRIFDEARALPQHRGALYEEVTYDLLRLWEHAPGTERAMAYRNLSLAAKCQLLADLAVQAFERGAQLLPREWLVAQIEHFFRRLPASAQIEGLEPAEVLHQIEIQHGLLVAVTPDSYSFAHPSLHEYFVACYFVSRPHEQIFRKAVAQAANPQWREVLLFMADMLDYNNSRLLFDLWGQQLQDQLRASPPLTQLLRWLLRHGQRAGTTSAGLRAAALTMLLIDQAIMICQELIVSLENRDEIEVGASDADRTLAIARDRAHALAFARASARTLAFARDALDIDLDIDLDRAHALAHAQASALTRAYTSANDYAHAYSAQALDQALDRTRALDRALLTARASARIAARLKYVEAGDPYTALKHMPQQRWRITDESTSQLSAYLASCQLLLDALDLATVDDRLVLLDRLFLPPGR